MDKCVTSLRNELKGKKITYIILLPRDQPYKLEEQDDSFEALWGRLAEAIRSEKKGQAFDLASLIVKKLEGIYKDPARV